MVISSGTQLDTERNERKKGAAQAIFHFEASHDNMLKRPRGNLSK